MQEFSELELHELVDKALAVASERGSLPAPVPVSSESPTVGIHFPEMSYLEIDLIEQFHNSMLNKGVDSTIRSEILAELREQLTDHDNTKVSLEDLRTRIHNCRKCSSAVDEPHTMVGNTVNPKVLFVLASPGGDLTKLTDYLSQYDFSKTSSGVTFVTRCSFPRSAPPEYAINNCANYLFSEFDYLQPELIVPMGAIPLRVIAGDKQTLTDAHGKVFWLGTFKVFPIFTPTYAEKANKQAAFETDLKLLKQVAYA